MLGVMTMADLGPERPGEGSETRQWGERNRAQTEPPPQISNKVFGIAIALIIVAVALILILRG
jgi:hypothetical protein